MLTVLAVFAGLLLLIYSVYFIKILQADPENFEFELMKSLAQWMINRGPASRWQMWMLYIISVLLEAAYFCLVFYLLGNAVIRLLSAFFAGFEALHLLLVGSHLRRFFQGKIPVKNIFNWPVERSSAMLFFTHSLLVLINIIFYPL